MNVQIAITTSNDATIAASIANGKVYVRLGQDTCLFLSTAEAVDLIDAVAGVLATIESSAVPIS